MDIGSRREPGLRGLLTEQARYLADFWQRSDVHVENVRHERARLSTVEMQKQSESTCFILFRRRPRLKTTA